MTKRATTAVLLCLSLTTAACGGASLEETGPPAVLDPPQRPNASAASSGQAPAFSGPAPASGGLAPPPSETGGFTDEQAAFLRWLIDNAVSSLATKDELRRLEVDLRTELAGVRTELAGVRTDVAGLRTDVGDEADRVISWLLGTAGVIVAVFFGAVALGRNLGERR